ncbi:two-component regulator propeller domain-containing protein [Arthrospiribacter ruber]|uniref:histidine kinase n=1 Tax=Arthrospiribacter ruber TaxID=2487934 RepID=A0A951MII0_9BACT|nr:two-component regulator propeller domain-containing protein [Arthrospiribacter ruber]MBW3466813.1 hybrid sensor histidine kinase/response regulator [Arthrospiribacter ruber]MBW3469605.1 hybrid sensor histidine kinase/response regulator [Arthrospiribacter ruber]MBW3470320.1 hybrid sensor histidine kinase/response regulator [Arthrospiribacter ruber]
MRKYLIALLAVGSFLLCKSVWSIGQTDQIRFSSLGIKDGVSHMQVNTFLKDTTGYMWIGTAAGLNRYDGHTVKVFEHKSNDSTTLDNNMILELFTDPLGRLCVKTELGINFYDPTTQTFSRDYSKYSRRWGLEGQQVHSIKNLDNTWFLTDHGLARWNAIKQKAETIPSFTSYKLSDMGTYGHELWAIKSDGVLLTYNLHLQEITEIDSTLYQQTDGDKAYQLKIDSSGRVWIYLPEENSGLYCYQDKEWQHFTTETPGYTLSSNLVRSVEEIKKGEIWVGTDHGGINIITEGQDEIAYLTANSQTGLSGNSIYTIYKDRDDFVWVGTYKNAVSFFHEKSLRFYHLSDQERGNYKLPFNDINSFSEDHKGNWFAGTNGKGILYFDTNSDSIQLFDSSNFPEMQSDIIVSLLYDSKQRLWAGTYLGGLIKLEKGKLTVYDQETVNLPDMSIWELFEDSKGRIWLGTLTEGIFLFDPETMTFSSLELKDGHELNNNTYISAIEEDDNGRIWIGGTAGIDIIYPESGQVEHLSEADGLAHDFIMDIKSGPSGIMCVGSRGGLTFISENKNISNFSVADGLPHSNVLSLLYHQNELWLSTPHGLSVVRNLMTESKITIQAFNADQGLLYTGFNENAAAVSSKGELVFGGTHGIYIVDPGQFEDALSQPKVVFSDFELFNNKLRIGETVNGRTLLGQDINYIDKIVLKPGENSFSVGFTSLDFLKNSNSKYRYRLKGFENSWQESDNKNRRAVYTNLNPGKYLLEISAANPSGQFKETSATLAIQILPPFYQTGWAYFMYAVMLLGVLYFSRRLILSRANAKFQIEQERREAQQLHELDKLKIRFLTNLSHEFRTPISLILAPIEKLLSSEKESPNKKQYQLIYKNANRILKLTDQILDFKKLEQEEEGLNLLEGDLMAFIKDLMNSFYGISERQGIKFEYQLTPLSYYTSFDMDKLEKIIFNLLSNSFKFTADSGTVSVKTKISENIDGRSILTLCVADSGVGIPAHDQARLFERFYQVESHKHLTNTRGSGIGLAITKEYVDLHGGSIHFESKVGVGTTFYVSLPLNAVVTPVPAEEPIALSSTLGENKVKILVAEDNPDFRAFLIEYLQEDFQVIEASNGKEGWKKTLAFSPDLILSDLMMPEVNGISFCRKVKNDPRTSHIPFILLTAFTDNERRLQSMDIGANDYITKPFNYQVLNSRIKNLIQEQQNLKNTLAKKVKVSAKDIIIDSEDQKFVYKVTEIVEKFLENPEFNVKQLSDNMAMSRVHLYNKLTALTGMTPQEFIRDMRLKRSIQYLEKSKLSIAEIAYAVGFNSPKVYSKSFKSTYGYTPSDFLSSQLANFKNSPNTD